MAFTKTLNSEAEIVVMGGGNQVSLFPIGFKYMLGDTIFTVTKKFFNDNTEWRRLVTTDGVTEDVTVDTMIRDFREASTSQNAASGRKGTFIKIIHDPDDVQPEVKKTPELQPEAPAKAVKGAVKVTKIGTKDKPATKADIERMISKLSNKDISALFKVLSVKTKKNASKSKKRKK